MTENLDKLIKESEEAIQRLDAIQKARHNTPLLQRVQRHFHKNSPHLINVLLAGSVLVVALGRLSQKQTHQAEKDEWEAAQRKLEAEKASVERKAAALRSSTEMLVAALEEAAEGRGRRDLQAVVRQHLEDWRQSVGGTPAAAAAATGQQAQAALEGSDDSGNGDGGSKIMF